MEDRQIPSGGETTFITITQEGAWLRIDIPYPNGYSCCSFTEFKITGGIVNPNATMSFSSIKFVLTIRDLDNNELARVEEVQLEGEPFRYIGHRYSEICSVISIENIDSTARETTYNFSFSAPDYPIPANSVIRIELPPGMRFIGEIPSYTSMVPFHPSSGTPIFCKAEEIKGFGVVAIRAVLSMEKGQGQRIFVELVAK